MMCSYDSCGAARPERPESCDRCMTGIMILVGIIGGILFSIGATILFLTSLLTFTIAAVLTALIFGLVFLFVVIIGSAASERFAKCVKCSFGGLLFGILGTIFSSFLGVVTVGFIGIGIFATIVVALTAFFFAYTVISGLFLARCLSRA